MDLQRLGKTALVFGGFEAALPAMQSNGRGRILAVMSMAAREPQPGLVMSNALRAGLRGEPAEFAALAAFLASGRASCSTRQAIAVDGGFLHSI